MPRIIVKGIPAECWKIKDNVCNYVAREDKCIEGYIGATNIFLPDERRKQSKIINRQMENGREYYGKTDTRLGIHVIIAFSADECKYLSKMDVLCIAYQIAENEFRECMTYFAVHDHTDLLHIDMLIDPMSVKTGIMYGCNSAGWRAIGNHIVDRLKQSVPEEKIGDLQVNFDAY